MAKPRKVIRTKTLYKKSRFPKKAMGRILFFLLILALIGVGFIVMREWSLRFGTNAPKEPISSLEPVSSALPKPVSSKPPVSSKEEEKAVMPQSSAVISAEELLNNSKDLKKLMESYKAKGDAVTIELKPVNGKIYYQSKVSNVAQYGAQIADAPTLADIFKEATDAGLEPIAQISAFKDQTAPHVSRNNSFAYDTSLNVNWLDNSFDLGGKAWLNPYMEEARKYLCDIAKEIADAGFKFIAVDNVMFPDKNTNKMNTILTTPSRDDILAKAFKEIEEAVPNVVVTNVSKKPDSEKTSSENGNQ